MRINKGITRFIFVFLIMMLSFVMYKWIMLSKYTADPIEDVDKIFGMLSMEQEVEIYKRPFDENNWLTFENIKVRNDFDNYVRTVETDGVLIQKHLLYDDNDNVKSAFFIAIADTYINMFTSGNVDVYGSDGSNVYNQIDRTKILKDNNINNDIEFFEYIKNNYYLENNIFTKVNSMKANYAVNLFVQVALPSVDSMSKITGDYTGYVYNINNQIREFHILKEDKSYIFTFFGGQLIKDDYIKDLLSTLEIE